MVPTAIKRERPHRVATGGADEPLLKLREILHEVQEILCARGLIAGSIVCPKSD